MNHERILESIFGHSNFSISVVGYLHPVSVTERAKALKFRTHLDSKIFWPERVLW